MGWNRCKAHHLRACRAWFVNAREETARARLPDAKVTAAPELMASRPVDALRDLLGSTAAHQDDVARATDDHDHCARA